MPEQQYVSFATADLREQSNLFDDVNARVVGFQFTPVAPANYTTEPGANPIFGVLSLLIDGDAPEAERTVSQSYSLGATSGNEFAISPDGFGLIPIGSEVTPRRGSKFTTLTESFESIGITSTLLKMGNFGKLIGLYGHWKRVADKPRNFRNEDQLSKRKGQSKFPPSTLVLTSIISMPGEAAATKTKAPAASKSNGKAAVMPEPTPIVETGDVDEDTKEYLLLALANNKGTLQRGQLTLAIGKAAGLQNPNRSVYAKRAFDENYLKLLDEMGIVKYAQSTTGQPISLPQSN